MAPGLHIELWKNRHWQQGRFGQYAQEQHFFLMSAACNAGSPLGSPESEFFFLLSVRYLAFAAPGVRGVEPPVYPGVLLSSHKFPGHVEAGLGE